jgi:hypothetical protein
MYVEWLALRKNSGFGWDEERQLVTAPNAVWDTYLKVSILVARRLYLHISGSSKIKAISNTNFTLSHPS